jgi:hypothetical protein
MPILPESSVGLEWMTKFPTAILCKMNCPYFPMGKATSLHGMPNGGIQVLRQFYHVIKNVLRLEHF